MEREIWTPLLLDRRRPFVDLMVVGPEGREAVGRFLVDTGGGGLILAEDLARAAGMNLTGENVLEEWGTRLEPVPLPRLAVDGQTVNLALTGQAVVRLAGGPDALAGSMIPGKALSRYRVVFDYPAGRFGLLPPNAPGPAGSPVPTPVHPQTMFPLIEVEVDGSTYGMLLDTGLNTGTTMISPTLFDRWSEAHPDWITEPDESVRTGMAMLDEGVRAVRLPHLRIGPFEVPDVLIVARQAGGRFEEFSARAMAGLARGALGGNVLSRFRIEIDYERQITTLDPEAQSHEYRQV